jgi:hypothetical protein
LTRNQLNGHHFRRISDTTASLDDSGVPTWSILKPRGNIVKQL